MVICFAYFPRHVFVIMFRFALSSISSGSIPTGWHYHHHGGLFSAFSFVLVLATHIRCSSVCHLVFSFISKHLITLHIHILPYWEDTNLLLEKQYPWELAGGCGRHWFESEMEAVKLLYLCYTYLLLRAYCTLVKGRGETNWNDEWRKREENTWNPRTHSLGWLLSCIALASSRRPDCFCLIVVLCKDDKIGTLAYTWTELKRRQWSRRFQDSDEGRWRNSNL